MSELVPADPTHLTAHAAAAAMRAGALTSAELTEAYLGRIAALDATLGAFLTVTPEVARAQAAEADRRRAGGEDGPLLGVPFALKDIFTTAGIRTTAGSRILENYVPPDDATVYHRLRAAGAVLLGKLNMDEFAMGSSNESSAYGPVRNPWDLSRVPGGSSGGAAAAVAAGLCAFAVGTDTGGSIRQPAALSGVVGLKPTYGRVSRSGMIAFASSLDQAGPLTRDARDAALVLAVIAGRDPADATSLDAPVADYVAAMDERGPGAAAMLGGHGLEPTTASGADVPGDTGVAGAEASSRGAPDLRGLRLGVPAEYFAEGLEPEVRAAVEAAIAVLESAGAERVPVRLPHAAYAIAAYYVIVTAEASANLARFDGVRYGLAVEDDDLWARYARTRGAGFGLEVKRRIMLGTFALSSGYYDAYYVQASRIRDLIRADFDAALARCDVVVGPTTPAPAFKLGEKLDDPLAMYLSDIYTSPLNLAGNPGVSVPCGLVRGLPVGLQIMGRPLDEATVLRVAHAYQHATDWHTRRPGGFATGSEPSGAAVPAAVGTSVGSPDIRDCNAPDGTASGAPSSSP